jgi:hypothetical protein
VPTLSPNPNVTIRNIFHRCGTFISCLGPPSAGSNTSVSVPACGMRVSVARYWSPATYGDAKVANREIRVWHGATENGP